MLVDIFYSFDISKRGDGNLSSLYFFILKSAFADMFELEKEMMDLYEKMAEKKIVSIISGGNIDINFMERIPNETLVKEGRRFRFKVDIPDRGGALQELLQVITNQNANIIQIYQSMFRENLDIGKYEMDLVIECADMEHREMIKKDLVDAGYDLY